MAQMCVSDVVKKVSGGIRKVSDGARKVSDVVIMVSKKCQEGVHIVPFGKFHRIGGAPPVKYDAPEEIGGDRKCFDSPIRK